MTFPKQTTSTQVAASGAHLPEHLRQVAEGAIVDWLIRTGQWSPGAQGKIETQEMLIEPTVPRETLPKQESV